MMQEPLIHNVSLKSYLFNNSLCKAKQVRIIILGILNRIRKWTGEMNYLFYLKQGQDSSGCCFCLKSLGTRLRSGGKRRKRAEIGKISMSEATLSPSQTSLGSLRSLICFQRRFFFLFSTLRSLVPGYFKWVWAFYCSGVKDKTTGHISQHLPDLTLAGRTVPLKEPQGRKTNTNNNNNNNNNKTVRLWPLQSLTNCGRFARKRLIGFKSIRPMTYDTLQHGEPTSACEMLF